MAEKKELHCLSPCPTFSTVKTEEFLSRRSSRADVKTAETQLTRSEQATALMIKSFTETLAVAFGSLIICLRNFNT